ncbi:hypothetical protein DS901_15985 [Loktanella sp. D2R18]|nr:hypothetical protein [Yoonia sp. 1_MG-2023]RBW42209.1 hypothetical protein DS901_15985 [Loktanella sp. D2R18]
MIAFGFFATLFSGGYVLDAQIVDGLPQLEFRDDRTYHPGRFGWVGVSWFEYYVHVISKLWFHVAFVLFVVLMLIEGLKIKLPQWLAAFKQGMEEAR